MTFQLRPIRREDDPIWHAAFLRVNAVRPRLVEHECEWCGDIFAHVPTGSGEPRRYCTATCRRHAYNDRRRVKYAERRAA